MILGITGTNASGKTTIVELLQSKGFTHFSARTFLSAECERRGVGTDRDNLIVVANDLREKHGPDYIIRSLYEMAKEQGGDIVIESIRSVGEVNYLTQQKDFKLIAVDADQKLRYERAVERASKTDNISFEKFVEQEKAEANNTEEFKQNIQACMKLADITIQNNGSEEEFEKVVFEKLQL